MPSVSAIKIVLLLAVAFIGSSVSFGFSQAADPFVRSDVASGLLIEKMIVVRSDAEFDFYEEPKLAKDTAPPEPFSVFWRLKTGTPDDVRDGYYLAGNSSGDPILWIKKDSVLPWRTRFLLEPISSDGESAFTLFNEHTGETQLTRYAGHAGRVPNGHRRIAIINGPSTTPSTEIERRVLPVTCFTAKFNHDYTDFPLDIRNVAIDVVFVIGSTGGAEPLVELAKEIVSTLRPIVASMPSVEGAVRVGVVEYRDQDDEFVSRVPLRLTSDLEKVYATLQDLECRGGGDPGDAVTAGLEKAMDMAGWVENSAKHIILFGDTPDKAGVGPSVEELTRRANPHTENARQQSLQSVIIHAIAGYRDDIDPEFEQQFRVLTTGAIQGYFATLDVRRPAEGSAVAQNVNRGLQAGIEGVGSLRQHGTWGADPKYVHAAQTDLEMESREISESRERELDIVFVIGTTSGTEPLVVLAKDIVDQITSESSMFSLVEYCDVGDEFLPRITLALSGERENVRLAFERIECKCGINGTDELAIGLEFALHKVKWREHSARHIIVLGDAPNLHSVAPRLEEIVRKANRTTDEDRDETSQRVSIHAIASYTDEFNVDLEKRFNQVIPGFSDTLNIRDTSAPRALLTKLVDALTGPTSLTSSTEEGAPPVESAEAAVQAGLARIYVTSNAAGDREIREGFARTFDRKGNRVAVERILITREEVRRLWYGLDRLLVNLKRLRAGRGDIAHFVRMTRQVVVSAVTGDVTSRSADELERIIAEDLPFTTNALRLSIPDVAAMESEDFDALIAVLESTRTRMAKLNDSPDAWFRFHDSFNQEISFLEVSDLP